MSVPAILFPTAVSLELVRPQVEASIDLTNDPLLSRCPITTDESDVVMWERGRSTGGLQGLRGIGGLPNRVELKGADRYIMEPGYYGDFVMIDEMQKMRLRAVGKWTYEGATSLLQEAARVLYIRYLQRVKQIVRDALLFGRIHITNGQGLIYAAQFDNQTLRGSDWGTAGAATPLADFTLLQDTYALNGANFGEQAVALVNLRTANKLLANTNAADLGGKRFDGGATLSDLTQVNNLLLRRGQPQIRIWNDVYHDEDGNLTPWIPDDYVLVMGIPAFGQRIGTYKLTRNVGNPNAAPGRFTYVKDEPDFPFPTKVSEGHNGGFAFYCPEAVVAMYVGA